MVCKNCERHATQGGKKAQQRRNNDSKIIKTKRGREQGTVLVKN